MYKRARISTSFRLGNYINGNYYVKTNFLDQREKRTLRVGENFHADFPDSIDLKITNQCSRGCPFCHENSTPGGKSFNLEETIRHLDQLPKVGIELAIGGGNVLMDPEKTAEFLSKVNKMGFIPRITIRSSDILDHMEILKDLDSWDRRDDVPKHWKTIFGLPTSIGVSLDHYEDKPYIEERKKDIITYNNPACIVWHVIVGITPLEDVKRMLNNMSYYKYILFLGFKAFGRNIGKEVPDLTEWKKVISSFIYNERKIRGGSGSKVISFDTLALSQLGVKGMMTGQEWEVSFQGQDFSSSMYIDAVEGKLAPNSTCPVEDRVDWNDYNIVDYFKRYHNEF